jgi:predicted ester cyclase
MPYLGIAKPRIADQIGSAATKGEGRQNMLCAYLAGALLLVLLGNAAFGAWWLDPLVGLLIADVAVREGLDAWRGEACCVGEPLEGAGFADDRRKSFPDVHMQVVQMVAEGDTVAAWFVCSGTHVGRWRGHEPTGRRFRVDEVYFFGFDGGRIARARGLEDTFKRLCQLRLLDAGT